MAQDAGFLRVVTPDELTAMETADAEAQAAITLNSESQTPAQELRNYIQHEWAVVRDHRSTSNLDLRLMDALRAFNGSYNPAQLSEIKRFGGSPPPARRFSSGERVERARS